MDNCLQCSEPLKHVPGRKEKSFCNVNCRNKYFYAQRKKQIQEAAALLVSLPPDYAEVKKVAIITKEGDVKPLIFATTHKKPKSNAAARIDDSGVVRPKAAPEVYDSPPLPKNLDELKKLCPLELTGFDRSAWISTERQKYGI